MKNALLSVGFILFWASASVALANNSPELQEFGYIHPNSSAMAADSVNFAVSTHLSEPDGDDLGFFVEPWSEPLPWGLAPDSETGVIAGVFPDPGDEITFVIFLHAEDPSEAR